MDLEDSYEGAARRMKRLEAARLDIFEDQSDRTRELEELATLACEDNERLKAELAAAVSENEQLRANVASLQQALARAQQAQAWPQQAQSDPLDDELLDY